MIKYIANRTMPDLDRTSKSSSGAEGIVTRGILCEIAGQQAYGLIPQGI
ncbi:MAG: hypothetical protein RIG62_09985 [Cyclobacteriaceae bacterium]